MARKEENIYKRKERCWEGRYIKSHTSTDKSLLFSDIAEKWLESRKPQLKESTYIKYRNLLNSYVFPFLGETPVCTLSCEDVKNFCNELISSGGIHGCGLSRKTVSDILSLMRNILKYSAENINIPLCDISSVTIKQLPQELRVLSRREEEATLPVSLCKS